MSAGPNAPSLPESYRSIPLIVGGTPWRRLVAFLGPGYLVAVGYIDPGNWATDLAGGSRYGYSLLWVILLSNGMAMLFQTLAARLGIATGRDLAQACREAYSTPVVAALWLLAEVAICATDLAEVIGTAIALDLLFGVPLVAGVCITALDVLVVLWLQQRGFRYLEALTITLVGVVFVCFAVNLVLARPDLGAVAAGFVPNAQTLTDPGRLYIAVGIIGATVMPHNLYLHSSIVQTRRIGRDAAGRAEAVRFATIDVIVALAIALAINAGILILSAAVFHGPSAAGGGREVAEIADAYRMLSPALGAAGASTLFGIALLASGQSSTLTATLTGQIVMEGFLALRLTPALRRLVTRGVAIVPAVLVTIYFGESGLGALLVLSQAVLSLQLPFAIIPLIRFTSDRRTMGPFASSTAMRVAAYTLALVLVGLNAAMLVGLARG